ncbi:hypothetical protein PybrP1_009791 [[Pythium] brassicae (nom. inval.)]|nr:hypothetical protein PybrP1_009791 [[Pythium] brassicae (nom. inval.)]
MPVLAGLQRRKPAATKSKKDKPSEAREKFLNQLRLRESGERKKTHDELMQLTQQINALIRKEQKLLPAYQHRFKDEDPRSVFYYRMLRRIGLPEVHARFAPWFLKSHQIQLNRWSSVLFARLEQAFYARPEALSTLEQNQLLLARAFRECSFRQRDDKKRNKTSASAATLANVQEDDALAIEKLELIPPVPVESAPPGLAPQVPGQLESHGKHVFFSYSGRWKGGEMHGPMGVYAFSDGGRYAGAWERSQPSGSGTTVYPNGVTYTGSFADAKFHGFGVMEMQSGSSSFRYEGEFRRGARCGRGTLRFLQSNTQYDGEFYANMRHGKGVETNALGYAYAGAWRANRICGPGTLSCPDATTVFKHEWPLCVLGEAVRLVRRERAQAARQQEAFDRQLLRVRDDLRALDLQHAFWDAEDARLQREEDARVERLKKARREKREAQAAAKRAFTEKTAAQAREEEEGEDGGDSRDRSESDRSESDRSGSDSEDEDDDEEGNDDDDDGGAADAAERVST